ncbi:hypothetical protein [Bacillus sp. NPDC094077]|uniref:hypothetical protein n=1 Tax=Bacillus sp. NPDC094077 TaxID=3390932 RepID=UPI003D06EE01
MGFYALVIGIIILYFVSSKCLGKFLDYVFKKANAHSPIFITIIIMVLIMIIPVIWLFTNNFWGALILILFGQYLPFVFGFGPSKTKVNADNISKPKKRVIIIDHVSKDIPYSSLLVLFIVAATYIFKEILKNPTTIQLFIFLLMLLVLINIWAFSHNKESRKIRRGSAYFFVMILSLFYNYEVLDLWLKYDFSIASVNALLISITISVYTAIDNVVNLFSEYIDSLNKD